MKYVIDEALSLQDIDFGDIEKTSEYFNRQVMPILRSMREIVNEKSSHYAENAEATYAWDLSRVGSMFIKQTAGAALTISPDPAVVLEKLRTGREWRLKIYNTTGAALTVTLSSDFESSGPWAIPAGMISCRTFDRLDDDAGLARLIELD